MDTDVGACNFGFAFNNPKFSDRVLSIEITPDPVENGTSDLAVQNRKRSRDDVFIKQENGGEGTTRYDACGSRNFFTVLRVKTLHINSAIMAAKSPLFYKLFSNGMTDSERVTTLRIHASEEDALMEVLNFVYKNTLSPATPTCFLDILMSAHKFEVASCMRYCSQRLSELPMTLDFALCYLDLPPSVLHADALVQLTASAKRIVACQFRDIYKFENQVLNLSLDGIEAILSSDDIQIPSEDVVYDLVLNWVELHYPELEERRRVLATRLRPLIRFPYMTNLKLKQVLTSINFSPELASEIVLDALFFKTETPYRQRQLASGRRVASETIVNTDQPFVQRAYMWSIKAVELEVPCHHSVAYLDLKREDCVRLYPAGRNCSEAFHLGTHNFSLYTYCKLDQENVSECFGLFLGMQGKGSESLVVDYEVAAWSKEEEKYKTEFEGSHTFTGGKLYGLSNLFDTTWSAFIADDSPYFINGILHLKAMVTFK